MTVFIDRSTQGGGSIGNGWQIIAAVDGDGDGLIGIGTELVGDACCVGLANALAFCQRLSGWCGVVERVGPDAGGGINVNGAVGGGGAAGNRPTAGGVGVDISGIQGPRNAGGSSQQGSVV